MGICTDSYRQRVFVAGASVSSRNIMQKMCQESIRTLEICMEASCGLEGEEGKGRGGGQAGNRFGHQEIHYNSFNCTLKKQKDMIKIHGSSRFASNQGTILIQTSKNCEPATLQSAYSYGLKCGTL